MTDQSELRESITNIVEAEYKSPNYTPVVERIDHIMQLITADRKRVDLEARIDELNKLPIRIIARYQLSNQNGVLEGDVAHRIAELKAQQEANK